MKATVPKCVIALAELTSEFSRFGSTENVLITSSGGNHRCEATNGRHLVIINGFSGIDDDAAMLIAPDRLKDAKRVLGKADFIEIESTAPRSMTISPIDYHSKKKTGASIWGEFELLKRESEDEGLRWPLTDNVIPKTRPQAVVDLDAKQLMSVLRAALAVLDGEGTKITLAIHSKTSPITLSCRNDDGTQFFDAILMPLVPAK